MIEDAVFRSEPSFKPANLLNYIPFWSNEILKDHPHKQKILGWLTGVKIEEFLNSFTSSLFQGEQLNSYYPSPKHMENYVPQEFFTFMNEQAQEWVNLGVLKNGRKLRRIQIWTPLVWFALWEWNQINLVQYGMADTSMNSVVNFLFIWTTQQK